MKTVSRFVRFLGILVLASLLPGGRVFAAVASAVPARAAPFPLQSVRLLDGPFKTAMDRDARYMLEIEPDRLLHNFRVNAGLPSAATEKLNHNRPGEFYDVEYDLPSASLAGEPVITVRFQANPGQIAGGLYDLRVLAPSDAP